MTEHTIGLYRDKELNFAMSIAKIIEERAYLPESWLEHILHKNFFWCFIYI